MKYLEEVKCIRVNNNKIKLLWKKVCNVEVKIYIIENEVENLVAKVKDVENYIVKCPISVGRRIFLLKAEEYHTEYIAEEILPFKGCINFRDLGGYKTIDGRRVKYNTFYRADKLSDFTEEDIRYFKTLGIKTILDLRCVNEVKSSPNPKFDNIKYINISAMKILDSSKDGEFNEFLKKLYFNPKEGEKFFFEGYRSMVKENGALKEIVDIIESEERTPLVFHCTQGKDRTGVVAAFILSILGVLKEEIIEDYLKSNIYRLHDNKAKIKELDHITNNKEAEEILKMMLYVKEEYIEEVFKEINIRYGSFDKYLEIEFSLSKTKRREIKKRYLF